MLCAVEEAVTGREGGVRVACGVLFVHAVCGGGGCEGQGGCRACGLLFLFFNYFCPIHRWGVHGLYLHPGGDRIFNGAHAGPDMVEIHPLRSPLVCFKCTPGLTVNVPLGNIRCCIHVITGRTLF